MDKRVYNNGPKENFQLSLKYINAQIVHDRETAPKVSSHTPYSRKEELIKKIETIFLNIAKCLADGHIPALLVKRKTDWKDCNFDKRLTLKAGQVACQEITLTENEKRFGTIINLLSSIHGLLMKESYKTKRELYYENTELFGNQESVNAAMLDICYLLQASFWELQVLSTSKGLVAGDLIFKTTEKEIINCSKSGGVLVPQNVKGISIIKSSAQFILIVEKDAAFQKLLDDEAHVRFGPCIIITGKGVPDINTRMLVCRLSRELMVPVLILVDANPYGIEIMCTYRFGSLATIQHSAELAAPEARWVGLHPTDIERLSIPTVPLTKVDFKKARDLARRPYIQQNEELLTQVNCLLQSGRKCEIENLSSLSSTFLTDMFLPYKITLKDVI